MSTPFVKVDTIATTTVECKCPLCGKHKWTVSHLFNDAAKREEGFYPVMWDCKNCNAKFDIRVFADKHVEMSQSGVNEDPFIPAIVLLRSTMVGADGKPIYAVVNTRSFKSSLEQEKAEACSSHMHYYYTESTCPTNWFRDVIALVQDGDPDPHGCFEFIGARPREELLAILKDRPDANRHNENDEADFISDNLEIIFPELFGGGETIDGDAVLQSILTAPVPTNVQKVIAQGSMDDIEQEDATPIQALNARAWRELFRRLERRELVEQFKVDFSITQEMAEALVESKVSEAHPLQFDAVTLFMRTHGIPGFDIVDPLVAKENDWTVTFPGTIEDEIPPMSQAFHDKVKAAGGRITAAGIIYGGNPSKEDPLSFGTYLYMPSDMCGYWSRVFRQFEERNLIKELISRTSVTQELINTTHLGVFWPTTAPMIREIEAVMSEYDIKAEPSKES